MFDIYKQSFLKNNTTIWWGGENHDRFWDENTLLLYFFIVALTFYFSWKCEKHSRLIYQSGIRCSIPIKTRRYFFVILFVLLCIMGLRGSWVGMDTIVYSRNFENATSLSAIFNDGTTTEPLYKISQVVLRCLFSSRYIAIFIFSWIIIYFVFSTIKKYYNNISLIIAIPAFVCLYYFQSFNLIRITLAASFMLWSIPLLLYEDYKKYAIRILIASLMHYSSIVLLFPLGLLILYKKSRFLACIGAICLALLIVGVSTVLGDYISLINRYESYISVNDASGQIGIALFFDYLPCLFICYFIVGRNIKGQWSDIMVCFTISAFIIRLVAYFIMVAGRLAFHFMPLTIILLPYWLKYFYKRDKKIYNKLILLSVIWLLFRLHIYFMGYLASDGIMPYYFFWEHI